MKLLDTNIENFYNYQFSSDLKIDNKKESELDIFNLALFNKIMESIKDLYNMYIKSKYTKIVKHKAITLIV